jgi:hypothetical protein
MRVCGGRKAPVDFFVSYTSSDREIGQATLGPDHPDMAT